MESGEPREVHPVAHYDSEEDNTSLLQGLCVLLKYRYAILGLSFASAFVVGLLGLQSPRSYTASGSFTPQGVERSVGGAAALAGQFGISLPGGGVPSESPQFYLSLLRSRKVLGRLMADTFLVSGVERGDAVPRAVTLVELLEIEDEAEAVQRDLGIRWLQDRVSARVTPTTGIIDFAVTTPWLELSEKIGSRLLELVVDFNRGTRQSQAAAERAFVGEQISDAEERLRTAEDELERFFEANRQFENSPELVFEHDRLERQVAMRQELFTSLSQAYDDARIAEVRNTPLITVVESPEQPVQADPRGLRVRVLLAFMMGGMVGVGFAFTREFASQSRRNSAEDYLQFHQRWDEAVRDVRRVFGRAKG